MKTDEAFSAGGRISSSVGLKAPNKSSDLDMLDEVEKVIVYRQQRARSTKRAVSPVLDLDNNATEEHVLCRPANAYTVVAARIIYVDATSGTVAAATLRLGTALGGQEVVADSHPENTKAVGTATQLTLVSTDGVSISANGPLHLRFTGVAPTAAGKIVVEVEYEETEPSAVFAETVDLYSFRKNGRVLALQAYLLTAPVGARALSIDLQRGSNVTSFATILSGVLSLDNGVTDKSVTDKAIQLPDFGAGETLRLVVSRSGSSGTWPTGLVVNVTVRDEPN